jgi:hypothetical protein
LAVLIRKGVVVLFNLAAGEEEGVLEAESLSIGVDPGREERTDEEGRLWLREEEGLRSVPPGLDAHREG